MSYDYFDDLAYQNNLLNFLNKANYSNESVLDLISCDDLRDAKIY
ncbi:MAG TPA: hypothetical protein PKH20_03425 [Exilispira sp.]|nr:hypothetical protein [Exilispira sp.]